MSIQSISANLLPSLAPLRPENSDRQANASPVSQIEDSQQSLGPKNAESQTAQLSSQKKDAPEDELQDAVKQANKAINLLRSNLQFSVDKDTGIDVVKFIDIQTKEVIRQIPSEEMLAIAKRLDELKGVLIKDKA